MPVQLWEGGQEKIVSALTAYNRLSDDADFGDIASRLLRKERIHTMNRAGEPIVMQPLGSRHKDEPFERKHQAHLFVSETVPPTPPAHNWVGECTVSLPLEVTVRCTAPDEHSAHALIEETILGLRQPRPDLNIEVDNESVEALLFRIDQMRTPLDLGATHVLVNNLTEQTLLEDHT